MGDTALVGRADELAALRPVLLSPECRLLTLTGPPGVGKSQLAAALAVEVAGRFADGVVAVDLLGSTTAEAAAAAIGAGVGTGRGGPGSATARLVARLHDRAVLLVLDSCEAVPDLGPLMTEVVGAGRRLQVLATSQERIRVASERTYAVPPLEMPREGESTEIDRLVEVPAMAMLLARTREANPGFVLEESNAAAMVSICRQLEGLPLALEVAAARLAQFEPGELAVRLRNRKRLLDAQLAPSGRHRSLRTAIAWSHDLLGPTEREVFRRVSVFAGPWSLRAAEQVAGAPGHDVVAATQSLAERNLVRRVARGDGSEGFDLLESLRRYGREQLAASGEEAVVEARFRHHYADLAAAAESAFGTPDENLALGWIADDVTNIRAALASSIETGDLDRAWPLAAATGWYWYTRGSVGESAVVTDLVRADVDGLATEEPLGELRPGAVLVAGILLWARGDAEGAGTLLRRALAAADLERDLRRGAIAHAFLGHLARTAGDVAAAEREYTTAQGAFRALGSPRGEAWAQHDLGLLALHRGRHAEAVDLLERAAPFFEAEADAWSLAWVHSGLAEVAVRRRAWGRAADLLLRAVTVYAENGDLPRVEHCRALLAEVALARGPSSAADALARQPGPGTVVALARQVAEAATGPESPLTPRQREVAALVATGATNRQIGRRLGITDKTVEVHLSQIMTRLEVHNRAQVATHALLSGLEVPAG